MKCLICNAENEFGNFCSNCGTQLKEKCPECGKMEFVERKICETLRRKIHNAQGTYLIKHLFLPLIIIVLVILGGALATRNVNIINYSVVVLLFVLIIYCVFVFIALPKLEKKATQEFSRRHPEYAEAIKKSEEESK